MGLITLNLCLTEEEAFAYINKNVGQGDINQVMGIIQDIRWREGEGQNVFIIKQIRFNQGSLKEPDPLKAKLGRKEPSVTIISMKRFIGYSVNGDYFHGVFDNYSFCNGRWHNESRCEDIQPGEMFFPLNDTIYWKSI